MFFFECVEIICLSFQETAATAAETLKEKQEVGSDSIHELSLLQFLKSE